MFADECVVGIWKLPTKILLETTIRGSSEIVDNDLMTGDGIVQTRAE